MVGKNWKKILAVGICGLMAAGVSQVVETTPGAPETAVK